MRERKRRGIADSEPLVKQTVRCSVDASEQEIQDAQRRANQTVENASTCTDDGTLRPGRQTMVAPLQRRECRAVQGTNRGFARDRPAQHRSAVVDEKCVTGGWVGLPQAVLDQRSIGGNDMHAPAA